MGPSCLPDPARLRRRLWPGRLIDAPTTIPTFRFVALPLASPPSRKKAPGGQESNCTRHLLRRSLLPFANVVFHATCFSLSMWMSDPHGILNALAFVSRHCTGLARRDPVPKQLRSQQTLLSHGVYPACSFSCTLQMNIQKGRKAQTQRRRNA